MGENKHIETAIARFIAGRYRRVAEIGVGRNPAVATHLVHAGLRVVCTDITCVPPVPGAQTIVDDIFDPVISLYKDAELIYAVRPGNEMIPPMITLARRLDADLIVYHLGGEIYQNGGEIIDCGVILHRYHTASEPVKKR